MFRGKQLLVREHSAPFRKPLCTHASHSQQESLIPATLQGMKDDVELQEHLASLQARGQAALTREERKKRQRSLEALGVPNFMAVSQVRSRGGCGCGRMAPAFSTRAYAPAYAPA